MDPALEKPNRSFLETSHRGWPSIPCLDKVFGALHHARMQRSFSEQEPEWMDRPGCEESVLRTDLKNLETINRFFGGAAAILAQVRRLLSGTRRCRLLDLATGYGDHPRRLAAWASGQKVELTVVAVDFQRPTLRLAREATPPGQKIFYIQADARRLPFKDGAADWSLCTLALHHFSEADAVKVLAEARRTGAQGAVCIDLVRGRWAVLAVWLLTVLWMRNSMTRHDARLSTRRAFDTAELKKLALAAGWDTFHYQRLPWFRQAIRWVRPHA